VAGSAQNITQGTPATGTVDRNAQPNLLSVVQKQHLQPRERNCGRMRLLQQKTGLSVDQITQMYDRSDAKNFSVFATAILVSQQLNLSRDKVLAGLRSSNLGDTLKQMGVQSDLVVPTIRRAVQQVVDSEKKSSGS
jgi:hypothetical protein